MLLGNADKIAAHLLEILSPGCERIEVAGSVRRRKPEVSDIDIVCVPRGIPSGQLRLDGRQELTCGAWPALEDLRRSGRLIPVTPQGEHYTEDHVERLWSPRQWHRPERSTTLTLWLVKPRVRVEIHRVTAEQWGCAMVIRTGNSDFARWLVSTAAVGQGLAMRDLRLWHAGDQAAPPIDTPEEQDVFAATGVPWIEPPARTGAPAQ